MKRYLLVRTGSVPTVSVYVGEVPLGPLKHLVRHSPMGFEWGYGGSGPADLARSIVGDVLDDPDPPPHYCQRVKALVARVPRGGGEITEAEVLGVIAS